MVSLTRTFYKVQQSGVKRHRLTVYTSHLFLFCHYRYLLSSRINALNFSTLAFTNLSSSSSTTSVNCPAAINLLCRLFKPPMISLRSAVSIARNSLASSAVSPLIFCNYYIEVSKYVCRLRFRCFTKIIMNIRTR